MYHRDLYLEQGTKHNYQYRHVGVLLPPSCLEVVCRPEERTNPFLQSCCLTEISVALKAPARHLLPSSPARCTGFSKRNPPDPLFGVSTLGLHLATCLAPLLLGVFCLLLK